MIIALGNLTGACGEQFHLFRRLFGRRVRVTLARCLKHAQEFDWDWAAGNLFASPEAHAYYCDSSRRAQARYDKATQPEYQEYLRATSAGLRDRQERFNEVTAPATKRLKEARARAFYRAAMLADKLKLKKHPTKPKTKEPSHGRKAKST